MSTYILIFTIFASKAGGPAAVEFNTLAACERAGQIVAEKLSIARPASWVCVEKGDPLKAFDGGEQ